MPNRAGDSVPPSEHPRLLKEALRRYAAAAGRQLHVSVTAPAPQAAARRDAPPAVAWLALTAGDAAAMVEALLAASDHVSGCGRRRRPGNRIGTSDVAARIHVRQNTIRGWLARGGPKSNPFPPPDQHVHGRNYWREATVESWVARREAAGKRQATARMKTGRAQRHR